MNVAKPMPFLDRPSRVLAREPLALRAVVGQRQRAIEQRRHVDRLADHLADRQRLARTDEIAPAELLGRQADGRGNLVHVPLEREDALRRAEAAKRAVRRQRWSRPRGRARARSDKQYGPGRVDRAARQHDRRQRAVRAAVDHEVDVHGDAACRRA